MKRVSAFLGTLIIAAGIAMAAEQDSRCFEMRTYFASAGKLDDLNARFRNHTLKLFEKHGIQNIGYWIPLDNPENKLIFLLAYPNREAREKSWKAFGADPDWNAVFKASEANGKLVTRVETSYLTATDYSPKIEPSKSGETRVFELRTYTAAPGKLDALNARFRNHTKDLFAKHGMVNFGYWTPMKDQKDADDTLIYILAHKSKEAAEQSFGAFGKDPAWVEAKKASEVNGPLTAPNGVKRLFMVPTDYSPTK